VEVDEEDEGGGEEEGVEAAVVSSLEEVDFCNVQKKKLLMKLKSSNR
jgi:hypothetical protein